MVVNTDSPSTLSSGVNETEEVLLSGLNLPESVLTAGEIGLCVLAIEQIVGCTHWPCVSDDVVLLSGGGVETMKISIGRKWLGPKTYRSLIKTAPISTS